MSSISPWSWGASARRWRFPFLVAGLAVLLGGCAITDYGVITDNNQVRGKRLGAFGGAQPVIDTRGKAHIQESSQGAIIWPDGSDELFSFVDQRADGTATLTTYNNFSTGAEPIFHDDLYCNTDRQGCAIWTAEDNNDDELFDGIWNFTCSGARSLEVLLATGRYYGECGRRNRPKLDIASKTKLVNMGSWATRYGMEGFLYLMDSSNSSLVLTDPTGYSEVLPFSGALSVWRHGGDNKSLVDFRDARLARMFESYASWLERRDPDGTTVTVTYQGISVDFLLGQNKQQGIDYQRVLERTRAAF